MRFNPLPLPKQGEIAFHQVAAYRFPSAEFQSAPLTEARGDLLAEPTSGSLGNRRVSIRSPYRSKGRFESVFDKIGG